MPEINFYLKKAEGDPPHSLVYLQMNYNGKKFIYSARFNVNPADWNEKKQRVKSSALTIKDKNGKPIETINDRLRRMEDELRGVYNEEVGKGVPQPEVLKARLDEFMFGKAQDAEKPTLYGLIDKFIAGRMGKKSPGTIKTYQTTKMHLENFERIEKFPVTYDTIKFEFKNRFEAYLEAEKTLISKKTGKKYVAPGLSPNSIAKEFKNIRTFMNTALDQGFTLNEAHQKKNFKVDKVTTSAVYLNDDELRSLFAFDFSHMPRLEAVRDLFIFSSFVGLRYGDASRIKPENIVKNKNGEYDIVITTQKTKELVYIPCNDVVLRIFKKYKAKLNRMPPAVTGQKYNQYLKELCQLAGLTETGRLASDLNKPLYEAITSHTARRSFATNCYLAGMDKRMIMYVTGHKTEASFNDYIKVTQQENANRMREHTERHLSAKKLKAV